MDASMQDGVAAVMRQEKTLLLMNINNRNRKKRKGVDTHLLSCG